MQVAYDHRHLANISCNLWETIVVWQTSPATCGRPSYSYKHLLQLAGDLRTPTNISCNLRETIVPLHTISCNLRETIVPLQTSPATCGRLSYPYIPSPATCGRLSYPYGPSPATCGRLSYPYKKVLQLFFSLTICASYRKPYFCFIKIQYPEEIIRKYTQLSR